MICVTVLMPPKELKEPDSSKLLYLFGPDYTDWSYESEYLMYATPHIISVEITKAANKQFNLHKKVVWDMFAGIGTDSLKFGEKAGYMIATESNPETFANLTKNVEHFRTKKNIEIHNIDCCKFTDTGDVNLIYFDPPWGDSFKSGNMFDFRSVNLDNGKNVVELAQDMQAKYPMIIKSPAMSDTFEEIFADNIIRIFTFPQQKLKFIFVEANN